MCFAFLSLSLCLSLFVCPSVRLPACFSLTHSPSLSLSLCLILSLSLSASLLLPPCQSEQFKATSPDLTLNGGLNTEQYQNGLKFGVEIILNYPVSIQLPAYVSICLSMYRYLDIPMYIAWMDGRTDGRRDGWTGASEEQLCLIAMAAAGGSGIKILSFCATLLVRRTGRIPDVR